MGIGRYTPVLVTGNREISEKVNRTGIGVVTPDEKSKQARKAGLGTPFNAALARTIKKIEEGKRRMTPASMEELELRIEKHQIEKWGR
ncbi:MAG: hypothetical protein C4576_31995 [Desulfobacteraceae bacterium]|nr:MAG: hypothetical protein C4576_31995 [Desulfobacteraceae bacterium]